MNPYFQYHRDITRRHFLGHAGMGIGAMALTAMADHKVDAKVDYPPDAPLTARRPHFAPRAKRVIYLHLTGAPPVLDMFDYKPELVRRHDQPCPAEFIQGRRFAFTKGTPTLLGTPRTFARYGESGAWLSDAVEGLRDIVDDVCIVKSMQTDQINHAPAELMLYTGSPRMGRPSMGSWVTYGLGTENQNLPGFVVLISSGSNPSAGKTVWGSGFLPSVFQGVQCRSSGDPVLFLSNPDGMSRSLRRMTLDALAELNQRQARRIGDPETQTRIAQYELAFRMQISVPEVMDITRETQSTLDNYGASPGASSFANNCLLARRLVEQGVRFVQLYDWGWDFHGTGESTGLTSGLTSKCATVDKPISALIRDLKQRGLLDDTLVVCGGEFGRTPFREGRTAESKVLGRDHFPDCFTVLLAGGGVKAGLSYGATDELGFSVVENKVVVHDLQATLLHLLGFDHERLTYRFEGRDYRLTDVHGSIVRDILA